MADSERKPVLSISEVAKAAGVSTATVSRVLNDLPGVRDETIQQVRMAVDELNYKPQRLRKRGGIRRNRAQVALRTGNIAVIAMGHSRSWLELPVLAAVVGGIQRGASDMGVRLILDEMPDVSKPSSLVLDRQIDGAIVFLSSDVPMASYDQMFKMMRSHVPLVWAMGMEMAIGGVDHVTPDNIGVGHQAYSYLRSLGCEETAFITTDPRWPLMRLRGQAFLNSAFDDGHPATAYLCGEDPSVGAPYGRQVVLAPDLDKLIGKLVKAKPFPTGLFIGNDLTTSYVYPLLADHGIKPGQDVHIVSCDNEDARLAAMHPRPASIDIGAEQIGIRAVNRLMNRIQHPNDPPLIIQVAARLIPPPAATPR
ncbi:MAG: LacI family DNA-binding transcriptional regulator [Tepidisphaeraceae bacterium]